MKWFRSNIRVGSRLALLALAIQFLLSFGHFHGVSAQAASASLDPTRLALHETDSFSVAQTAAMDRASHANASAPVGLKTNSSSDVPAGQRGDDCAICAVMALGKAMVLASPPDLPTRQAMVFFHLALDPGFLVVNSAGAAFRPRAPPIS
jgi:hypothetical protein